MDTKVPGFGIDISVIVTFAAISVLVFIFVIGMALKARHRPVVSGMEELIGGNAIALEDFDGQGAVSIHSERWNAVSSIPLHKGQRVKVKAIKGLILQVEPADTSTPEEST
jgi:membrane-bound serine protease (ClpP class)